MLPLLDNDFCGNNFRNSFCGFKRVWLQARYAKVLTVPSGYRPALIGGSGHCHSQSVHRPR